MQDWHRRYEMSSVSKIKTPTKIEKKMRSSISLRQFFLGCGRGQGRLNCDSVGLGDLGINTLTSKWE